jgi:hypothetical protein
VIHSHQRTLDSNRHVSTLCLHEDVISPTTIGCGPHAGQISMNLIEQAAAMLPDVRGGVDAEDRD